MVITDKNMKSLSERMMLHLFKFWGLICVKNTLDGPIFLYRPFIIGNILVWLSFPIIFYGILLEMKTPNSKWMPSITATVVSIAHYGISASTSIVIVGFAAWNYKEIGKVYSTIEIIESKLNVYNKGVKVSIIVLFLIILLIPYYIWDFWACIQINQFYLYFTPVHIYEMITIVFILQLVLITNRIKVLFRMLNIELIETLQSSGRRFMQKNLPSIEISASRKTFTSEIKSLPSLCDLHWDICEAIDHFNTSFKIQLQFLFFNIFLQLIDCPYFLFLSSRELFSSGDNFHYILTTLAWTLVEVVQIFIVVLPCGLATKIGNETSFILSHYLHSDLPFHMKKNIKSFLTLLQVHKTDFHCGIFTLNESVVSAITGSVTTYLVILIQFQNQDFDA